MASDTKNVKIGVCQVFLGGVDLGYTKGGVEVAVETETHEITVDQFGASPVGESIQKRTVSATVPLAETTLDLMASVMPGAELVTDSTDATKKKVVVPNGVGINLLDLAKDLVLHPQSKDASDKSEDFVIPLAATAGSLTFAYKHDEERVYNVSFTGYPNPTTKELFVYGDIDASAA